MLLSIVIPAYNEEAAIEKVLNATKISKEFLLSKKFFDKVEIIVINDGSQDNTAKILQTISGIHIINHAKNLGYGASLKEGFQIARGDILAFLDADGTYDPRELSRLVEMVQDQSADIAIGSRMGRKSQMPLLRKIGNFVFTKILHIAGGRLVTDVTSGMRVIRRNVLEILAPLPDGLDFTTVMTARAVLHKKLNVVEAHISYAKRRGKSKLNILIDGSRSLWKLLAIVFSSS